MAATDHPSHVEVMPEDTRARKRVEIGLAPHRPTAVDDPLRPPEHGRSNGSFRWLLALPLGIIVAATLLLIFARLLDAPTSWSQVSHYWRNWPGGAGMAAGVVAPEGYRVVTASAFQPGADSLPAEEEFGRYRIGMAPDDGVYRIDTWPNQLAWISPGSRCLSALRIEAEAVVHPAAPEGYAGLVARISDPRNFYLFAVDGQGAYQVLVQRDGNWYTLQPWTSAPILNPAGVANTLVAEDTGSVLRFGANGTELFRTDLIRLPAGEVGLAGGARTQHASVDFTRFALFDQGCSN